MIQANRRNRKAKANLTCPTCGMRLDERLTAGYVQDGETFCCKGCATGTGCTCDVPARRRPKNFNRPGDIGQRNADNSARDENDNQEVTTSGRVVGKRKPTAKAPKRYPRRGDLLANKKKAPRSSSEERDSTRAQAQGRSEMRGQMNKRMIRLRGGDRLTGTGTKSR